MTEKTAWERLEENQESAAATLRQRSWATKADFAEFKSAARQGGETESVLALPEFRGSGGDLSRVQVEEVGFGWIFCCL